MIKRLVRRKQILFCLVFFTTTALPQQTEINNEIKAGEQPLQLRSLQFDQQIDLNKIFKSTRPEESKLEKTRQAEIANKPDLELIGTLIVGEQKQAWIKIDNRVYQVEAGQIIPGVGVEITEIHAESVKIRLGTCGDSEQCLSSISILKLLF